MSHRWQLQDSKLRLSKVAKVAVSERLQTITAYLTNSPPLDEETVAVINDRSTDTGSPGAPPGD